MSHINSNSPFTRFWSALNDHLRSCGLPEINYGPAHRIWLRAIGDGGYEARASIAKKLRVA